MQGCSLRWKHKLSPAVRIDLVFMSGRLGQYVDVRTFQDTTHTDILTDPRVVLAIVEIAEANRPSASWTPMAPREGWLASLGRVLGRLVDRVRGRGAKAVPGGDGRARNPAEGAAGSREGGMAWLRRGAVVGHKAPWGRVRLGAGAQAA